MTTVIREKDIQEIRENQQALLNIVKSQGEQMTHLSDAVQEAIRSLSDGVNKMMELSVSTANNVQGVSDVNSQLQEEINKLKAGMETLEKVTGVTSM